jgi:hypothetical protein
LIGCDLLTYKLETLDNQVKCFISNLKKPVELISLEDTIIENVITISNKYLAIFTRNQITLYNVKTNSFIKTFRSVDGFSVYKSKYLNSKTFAFVEYSYRGKYLKIYDIEKNFLMTLVAKKYDLYCISEKYFFAFDSNLGGVIKFNFRTSNYEKTFFLNDAGSIADIYYIGVGYLMIKIEAGVLIYNIKANAIEAHLFKDEILPELICNGVYSNVGYLAIWSGGKVLVFDKMRQREWSISVVPINHSDKLLKIEQNEIYLQSGGSVSCYELESKKVKFERTLL